MGNLLDHLHESLRSCGPAFVTVTRENGDSLSIGLALNDSVLNFVRGDGSPPYYISSNIDRPDDQQISFVFGKSVVRLFASQRNASVGGPGCGSALLYTGDLSSAVVWQEV